MCFDFRQTTPQATYGEAVFAGDVRQLLNQVFKRQSKALLLHAALSGIFCMCAQVGYADTKADTEEHQTLALAGIQFTIMNYRCAQHRPGPCFKELTI